ncbi:MAG: GNAT family N-acetyltransferase [Bacteroidetes bacterium]|nr:MAG: GNAT family N-acetyltransferase [Bacteroidota bacterium]
MEYIIRKGTKEDLPGVLNLIRELALFEKAPDEVSNTLADMEEDGFGKAPVYSFFVGMIDETIVGMALYFTKYSTWKGKGLYLDDLVITESHRGKGLGSKLFKAFIQEAKATGAKQVHWQVLDWNTPAINFYKKLDAKIEAEWLDCKMTEDQIKHFDC